MVAVPFQPDACFQGAKRTPSAWRATFWAGAAATILYLLIVSPGWVVRGVVLVHLTFAGAFLLLRSMAVFSVLSSDQASPWQALTTETPSFTLLCPLYQEPSSVRNLVRSLKELRYPEDKVQIILLLEDDDHETYEASLGLDNSVMVLRVPGGGPKTKPNALNHGLAEATGELIGIYDAEDRPEADQLLRVAQAFAKGPKDLVAVQARLNFYNRDDSIITRLFALEYALHFDWFLPGLTRLGLPLPLGGTSNFVRRDALTEIGGWDPFNVTEDADLGMRLTQAGGRIIAIPSTTFEEATDSPGPWVRQRSRWLKGYFQTWVGHGFRPQSWRSLLVLHGFLGAVVVSALINPILWILFLLWAVSGQSMFAEVFRGGLGQVCLAAFILGNAYHLWMMMIAPLRRRWHDLVPSALLLPVIWVLQSVAGYKGAIGYLLAPHYWEKTQHTEGEDVAKERALA